MTSINNHPLDMSVTLAAELPKTQLSISTELTPTLVVYYFGLIAELMARYSLVLKGA